MPHTVEEEGVRDLPDSITFLALDAFGVLLASSLVVLGLWKVEQLVAGLFW